MKQANIAAAAATPVGRDILSALRAVLLHTRRHGSDDTVELATARTLAVLEHLGAARPSDVAAASCVDLSAISRQLKSLEDRRYVVRSVDPSDRRAHLIRLTASGRKVLDRHLDTRSAIFDQTLAAWSDSDRRALTTLMGRLADDLATNAPTPDRNTSLRHTPSTTPESSL